MSYNLIRCYDFVRFICYLILLGNISDERGRYILNLTTNVFKQIVFLLMHDHNV